MRSRGYTERGGWPNLATIMLATVVGGLIGGGLVASRSVDAASTGPVAGFELRKVSGSLLEVPYTGGGGYVASVACAPDELLVGGGYGMVRGAPRTLDDEPVFDRQAGVWQWEVVVANDEPGSTTRVLPSALCLRVIS